MPLACIACGENTNSPLNHKAKTHCNTTSITTLFTTMLHAKYNPTHTHIYFMLLKDWTRCMNGRGEAWERQRAAVSHHETVCVWNLDLLEIQVRSTISHIKFSSDEQKSAALILNTDKMCREKFTTEDQDFV